MLFFRKNWQNLQADWQYGQRYGHYMQLDASKSYLEQAGFEVIHHYYRPTDKPIHEQAWLAIVSRRHEN